MTLRGFFLIALKKSILRDRFVKKIETARRKLAFEAQFATPFFVYSNKKKLLKIKASRITGALWCFDERVY